MEACRQIVINLICAQEYIQQIIICQVAAEFCCDFKIWGRVVVECPQTIRVAHAFWIVECGPGLAGGCCLVVQPGPPTSSAFFFLLNLFFIGNTRLLLLLGGVAVEYGGYTDKAIIMSQKKPIQMGTHLV